MNVLYDVPRSALWDKVADSLWKQWGWVPAFWVGSRKTAFQMRSISCVFYDVWDAFELRDPPEIPESNDMGRHYNAFEKLSKDEYFVYLKLLDRIDGPGCLSLSERDHLLKKQLSFWVEVLTSFRIGLAVFSNIPHLPHSYPLYLVARQLGVRTIFYNRTPFANWNFALSDINGEILPSLKTGLPQGPNGAPASAVSGLENDAFRRATHKESEPQYMKDQRDYDRGVGRVFRFPLVREGLAIIKMINGVEFNKWIPCFPRTSGKRASIKSTDQFFGRKRTGLLMDTRIRRWELKRKKVLYGQLARVVTRPVILSSPFIFVPLHYQPEATSVPMGGYYADQLYMIERLCASLPEGWEVVVKEHYSQFTMSLMGQQGRFLGYYQELISIPGARLVGGDVSSANLIKGCEAVATISGTAGWEALTMGRPCVLFGNAWYRECPGATVVASDQQIAMVLNRIMRGEISIDEREVRKFLDAFRNAALYCDLDNPNEEASSGSAEAVVEHLGAVLTGVVEGVRR